MDEQQPQSHPLYATDRELVDQLLATETPAEAELVNLGRLLMRYTGFPGAHDLQDDLDKIKVRGKLKYLTVAPFRLFLELSRLGYRLYRLVSLRMFLRA